MQKTDVFVPAAPLREPCLYGTQRSPFARRVRIALLQLKQKFIWRELSLQELFPPSAELLSVNPLGLVPAYVSSNGTSVFDSMEILTHIDTTVGHIWPVSEPWRSASRMFSVMVQGILTYAVREFQGLRVPSPLNGTHEDNIALIARTLDVLECEAQNSSLFYIASETLLENIETHLQTDAPTQALWDLVVALEYLDFRLSEKIDWRTNRPALQDAYSRVVSHEVVVMTRPR